MAKKKKAEKTIHVISDDDDGSVAFYKNGKWIGETSDGYGFDAVRIMATAFGYGVVFGTYDPPHDDEQQQYPDLLSELDWSEG